MGNATTQTKFNLALTTEWLETAGATYLWIPVF